MMYFVITFPSNRSNDLVTRIKVLLVSHTLGQSTVGVLGPVSDWPEVKVTILSCDDLYE